MKETKNRRLRTKVSLSNLLLFKRQKKERTIRRKREGQDGSKNLISIPRQKLKILHEERVEGRVKYVGEAKKKGCGRPSQCSIQIISGLIG